MKHTVRIIGGKFRGRKLAVLDSLGLRPTPDRIRETVFNWLMHDVHGATCLDAFAGTGALGFEAMSRGAESVIFVEKDSKVAGQIQKNLEIIQECHPDVRMDPDAELRLCQDDEQVKQQDRHPDDALTQDRHPDDAKHPSGPIRQKNDKQRSLEQDPCTGFRRQSPFREDGNVCKSDIFNFLKTNTQKFDIIFLDPPFNKGILKKVLPLCLAALSKGGVIYIEHESSLNPEVFLPENINIIKQKKAGDVGYLLVNNREI